MRAIWRRRLKCVLAAALAVLTLSPQIGPMAVLPDRVVLSLGGMAELPASTAVRAGVAAPAVASVEDSEGTGIRLKANMAGETQLTYRLLGVLPLRTVQVSVQPARRLIPGGQSVGVALRTAGVVVVGASDLGSTPSPARLAGLKSGDVIQRIDGVPVTGARQLSEQLTDGTPVRLQLQRDGETLECALTPALDARDGGWKLGAWVRDSTAGVGTLTFYDPESGAFGALGHGITDIDTGVLMPVGEGEIYANQVVAVTRSREGAPGELTGDFLGEASTLGELKRNTACGIFGLAGGDIGNPCYPQGVPAAAFREIHTGSASLLTTVDGGAVREYACEIVRLTDRTGSAARSMVLRVTDPGLIAKTGGIVQGMSGSPILQDGKLIGAVTHVMVNDPAMGYGIGIEAMLEEARAMRETAPSQTV